MDKKLLDEMLSSLNMLVSIPSELSEPAANAPFGAANRKALDAALGLAKSFGFETADFDGYAGHMDFGTGSETLGILCHLDVVPAGGNWTYPPYAATVKDNMIYGRGVVDNKGSFVACLYAMRELKRSGYVPKRRVRLIAGCNEETGSSCIKYYKTKIKMPDLAFVPDADFPLINSEKGILHLQATVKKDAFASKNILSLKGGSRPNIVPDSATLVLSPDFKDAEFIEAISKDPQIKVTRDGKNTVITSKGKSAHGMCPEKGKNAVSILLTLFNALKTPIGASNGFLKLCPILGSQSLAEAFNVVCADDKSGAQTVNLGIAESDADNFYFTFDCRCPLSQDIDDLIAKIKASLPQDSDLEILHYARNLYVDEKSELVSKLLKIYSRHSGEEAKPMFTGGGTYAKELDNAVAFGPTFPGQMTHIHDADERLTVNEFIKMYEIYYDAIKELSK